MLLVVVMLGAWSSAAWAEKINAGMDWILSGRHGAWFAALDQGFYKAQGLDVKISRGWGTSDSIKKLMGGNHPVVFNDIATMVKALGQGSKKIRALAVVYARHPATFFSLKKQKILKPKDLEGHTIADAVFSTQLNLFPYFAKVNGIDASKVRWIKVQPKAKMSMLLAEKADVIGFYNMQIPLLEKKSAKLGGINAMEWGDWGVKLLSNGILTMEDTFQKRRGMVRKFVQASMKGFQYAIGNPKSAAQSVKKRFPLLDDEVTLKEVNIVSGIVQSPEAKKHGLGYISPERVKVTIEEIGKAFKAKVKINPDDVYSNEFIKKSY
jgi:NitT/TauT family transport system substrate-binding protein